MKNLLIILFTILSLTGCKKEVSKCRPYSEAVKDGSVKTKITTFAIPGDTITLDYVREQQYKDTITFCYGHIGVNKTDFKRLTKEYIKGYNPDRVRTVSFFCEGKDICNGYKASIDDARYLYIAYIDDKNNAAVDFINLETGNKQTHLVSSFYASVRIYHLTHKTGIRKYPSDITISNDDIDRQQFLNTNLVTKNNDALWQEAHKYYRNKI